MHNPAQAVDNRPESTDFYGNGVSTLLRTLARERQAGHMPGSGLTHEKAREFQRLMREECGVEMPIEAAWTRAAQLIALYRMLMGPIPEDPEVNGSGSGSNLDPLA